MAGAAAALTAAVAGCGPGPQIRTYDVPSAKVVYDQNHEKTISGPDRMLGAMLHSKGKLWFFKLVGNTKAVGGQRKAFVELLTTVEFPAANPDQPTWRLPPEWSQSGPTQTRYATISIPSGGAPLEIAVSSLVAPEEGLQMFERMNVNRWRGQLGLKPVTSRVMSNTCEEIATPFGGALLVDITGELQAAAAMPPPENRAPAEEVDDNAAPNDISFATPKGWRALPADRFRRVAFDIDGDATTAEVTISDGIGGSVLDNVNRWRNQVGLEPIAEGDLQGELQSVEIGGRPAVYVPIVGPDSVTGARASAITILAIVIDMGGGSQRFLRLKGPASLAEAQKANFEAFASSLEFHRSETESENNGD